MFAPPTSTCILASPPGIAFHPIGPRHVTATLTTTPPPCCHPRPPTAHHAEQIRPSPRRPDCYFGRCQTRWAMAIPLRYYVGCIHLVFTKPATLVHTKSVPPAFPLCLRSDGGPLSTNERLHLTYLHTRTYTHAPTLVLASLTKLSCHLSTTRRPVSPSTLVQDTHMHLSLVEYPPALHPRLVSTTNLSKSILQSNAPKLRCLVARHRAALVSPMQSR